MSHSSMTLNHGTIPRSAIESHHCASIDASLKVLRQASRRVSAFSTPYHNELQLLERIYYKGKNQHRSALFWRRVSEIRRFGTRIHEMDFLGFVEELRYAFYGIEARNNPKVLRGAWKQAPDRDSSLSVLRRLKSACLLVDQARTRFRKAHGAFTQQIQMATFLPLTISLISITSRLDFLVSELREIIAMVWQVVAQILDIIAELGASKRRDVQLPLDPLGLVAAMASRRPGATPKRSHHWAGIATDNIEDFGSIVPRESLLDRATPVQTLAEANLSPAHSGGLTMTSNFASEIVFNSLLSLPDISHQDSDITFTPSHTKGTPPAESHSPVQASPIRDYKQRSLEQGRTGKKQKIKKSRKAKRHDEIDDIFGF